MKEFKLELGGILYNCQSNHASKEHQNWHITAKSQEFNIRIEIPIDAKVSRAKCMAFVEAFHEALVTARKEQGI